MIVISIEIIDNNFMIGKKEIKAVIKINFTILRQFNFHIIHAWFAKLQRKLL
jgi:hypothetical protein